MERRGKALPPEVDSFQQSKQLISTEQTAHILTSIKLVNPL
jgi:hypothetical protein